MMTGNPLGFSVVIARFMNLQKGTQSSGALRGAP